MYFNITRQALAIRWRSNEGFGDSGWSTTFELHEIVLLNNVSHLFLLLLPLVDISFQISNLLVDPVETMTIGRPIGNRSNEGGIGVFKWLRRQSIRVDTRAA